jgi:signal transduction histidine kinase/CheY-like chemotaxis protein
VSQSASEPALRALILAPSGRDSAVASGLIGRANLESAVCRDLAQLVSQLNDTTAFVLLTEEAMRSSDLKTLMSWVNTQPTWSDLPFILMTHHGGGPERNPAAARFLETLGNVSFIERPFHPTTLLSVVRATIKSRQRQIEARELLDTLQVSQSRLQQLNDELERRVNERTRQLQRAHDELMAQVAERARTEDQLRHVQKIESLGELTGGVAHDFNNLLTAVLGNLELLRKRLPPNPATDRLIDGAMQGAQRGASLTQRLLAFARRQALEPRPVDLVDLVRGMTDLLRRSISPSIEIAIDLPTGLPPALADANQIELALLNLAVNARDAMPGGGTVSIGLALVESGNAPDLDAGRYLRLSVADTGVGMDEATLRRAIEPFFSTKDVGKGTGLGLSMIHGLAQQLKGALRLHSEPGKGTRADLWLPVAAGEPAAAEPERVADQKVGQQGVLVLFVDDDFLIRLSTASLLEDLGHTVIKAASGAEALEILGRGQKIDVLITDYAMPGMTGVQLAEAARTLLPRLPILLATGYADLPALANLDLPRLSKPYHQRDLAQQIVSLLA